MLFNMLAFGNNLNALYIPPGDCRFCILSNHTAPRDQSYDAALYAALDDAGFLAAMFWYLRRYNWSTINPRKPLQTKARAAIIETTKSPSEQIFDAIHDDTTTPDFMTCHILRSRIQGAAAKDQLSIQSMDRVIAHLVKRFTH